MFILQQLTINSMGHTLYDTISTACTFAEIMPLMMTSSNGNIFRVTGPLCGEFTGPGEFSAQRPVTRSVMFSLIYAWIHDWVNNREAGDLRRHRGHYDVIVMNDDVTTWKPFGATGALWSESSGHLWTTIRLFSNAQLWFIEQTVDLLVVWYGTPSMSCNHNHVAGNIIHPFQCHWMTLGGNFGNASSTEAFMTTTS